MKKLILLAGFSLASLLGNAQFKVVSSGNIIMGSTTPTVSPSGAKSHTIGNSVFTSSTSTVISSAPYVVGTNTYSSASAPDYTWWGDNNTGMFHSAGGGVRFTAGGTERLNINSGQTYSYNSFTVLSATTSITSAPYIRGTNTWSAASTPDFSWSGDTDCGLFHPSANIIGFSTGGAERFRLTNYGLLLGTTTDPQSISLVVTAPSGYRAIQSNSTFTYNGGFHEQINVNRAGTHAIIIFNTATSTVTAVASVEGDGAFWGLSFNQTSDKNLKENIDTLRSALDKINQLQGYTYNMKASVTGNAINEKEIGLMAQDVEKVVPEVVHTTDKGIKGISYGNLVALCIEGMKEQDKKITKLQNDLTLCCPNGAGQRGTFNENNNGNKPGLNPGGEEVIGTAKLFQNNPNPFNQITEIKCFVPEKSKTASLMIFDLNGTLKKTIAVSGKGETSVTIHAKEFIAGMYHYSLIVDGQEIDTKKMILTE